MNFQSLITDTGTVMKGLGEFLGLKKPWDDSTTLPEQHKKKPQTAFDCKSFDYLTDYYNKMNKGLIEFINKASDKPAQEPPFPSFGSNRSSCKENKVTTTIFASDLI